MNAYKSLAAAALIATALGACADRDVAWERDRSVIGPIALKTEVAYIDNARDRVIVIDTADKPRIWTYSIGRDAVFATVTPDKRHLAVITRGEEAVLEGQVDQDPQLWLVDVSKPDSVPVSYPVGSPFDRLSIAEDGATAVAYFSAGGPDATGFFRNPNEMAIIDLSRAPADDNPVLKTVRSFGQAPDGVILSPPMVVPGAEDTTPRVFAFVLSLGNVTVLDATHPERREVSIRLDSAGSNVRPREIVFAPNTATAYLRSDGARDILEILINADPPAPGATDPNDYRPALAELGAGGGPADVAVYDDATGRRLVLAVTPNTQELVVIDADTAQFRTFAMDDPVDRILLFPSGPDLVPQVAVLASLGSRLSRVHLVALDRITDTLEPTKLQTVDLDQPVLDVQPVPGRELAMIVHDDDRTVLGLLDVNIGSVSPLQGVGRLDSYAFTPDGDYLVGVTDGVSRVGFLELSNLHPTDLRLDSEPASVLALPGGAIFIDHGDPFGVATIIPSPQSSRDESHLLTGFLLSGLLDENL